MKRRARDEGGATAVEFALILIPMLVIIFGLIQYGLYFYSAQTGSNTANSALRQLSVGNCATDEELKDYVKDQLGAAAAGDPTVDTTWIDPSPGGETDRANVKVGGTVVLELTFPTINMNFPFVPFLRDPHIEREVKARVEDTSAQGCGA